MSMSSPEIADSYHTISRLELLILQFLNWKEPLYAYEIEKIIERVHARDWLDIGFSTIYYALNRLYKKGLVTRQQELQESKPPRVLYTRTFSGETILKTEVAKALHSLELPKSDYNQALLSIDLFGKDELLTSGQKRLARCQKALHAIQQAHAEQGREGMRQLILLRNMRLLEAEITWLTDWIEMVKTLDPFTQEAMLKLRPQGNAASDAAIRSHMNRETHI